MTASDWSGDWSGDKTSSSGWRTALRITKSLTWCGMRTRGSTWREQGPLCLTIKVKPANILLLLKNISFEFQGKSLTRVNLSGLTQRFLETCANKSALSLWYSGQMTSKVQIQVPKYLSCDDPLSLFQITMKDNIYTKEICYLYQGNILSIPRKYVICTNELCYGICTYIIYNIYTIYLRAEIIKQTNKQTKI